MKPVWERKLLFSFPLTILKIKMKILLIDDDVNLGKVISHQLRKSKYDVDVYTDGKTGLAQFAKAEYQIVFVMESCSVG